MSELEKRMGKLVKLYGSTDRTQEEFAAAHDISKGKLHYWIRKLSGPPKPATIKRPVFVPVEVPLVGQAAPTILIRLANGVEIEIPL